MAWQAAMRSFASLRTTLECYFIEIGERPWSRLWAWTKPETVFDIARGIGVDGMGAAVA